MCSCVKFEISSFSITFCLHFSFTSSLTSLDASWRSFLQPATISKRISLLSTSWGLAVKVVSSSLLPKPKALATVFKACRHLAGSWDGLTPVASSITERNSLIMLSWNIVTLMSFNDVGFRLLSSWTADNIAWAQAFADMPMLPVPIAGKEIDETPLFSASWRHCNMHSFIPSVGRPVGTIWYRYLALSLPAFVTTTEPGT